MKKNWLWYVAMFIFCLDLNAMMTVKQVSSAHTLIKHSSRAKLCSPAFRQRAGIRNFCQVNSAAEHNKTGHYFFSPIAQRIDRSHNHAPTPILLFCLAVSVDESDDEKSKAYEVISDPDILITNIGLNLKEFSATLNFEDPNQLISFLITLHLVVMVNMFDGARMPAEITGDAISRSIGDRVFNEIENSDWHMARIQFYNIYKELNMAEISYQSVGTWQSIEYLVDEIVVGNGYLNLSGCQAVLADAKATDPKKIWSLVNILSLHEMGKSEFRHNFADYYYNILPIIAKKNTHKSSDEIRQIIKANLLPPTNPFSSVMKTLFLD